MPQSGRWVRIWTIGLKVVIFLSFLKKNKFSWFPQRLIGIWKSDYQNPKSVYFKMTHFI